MKTWKTVENSCVTCKNLSLSGQSRAKAEQGQIALNLSLGYLPFIMQSVKITVSRIYACASWVREDKEKQIDKYKGNRIKCKKHIIM